MQHTFKSPSGKAGSLVIKTILPFSDAIQKPNILKF